MELVDVAVADRIDVVGTHCYENLSSQTGLACWEVKPAYWFLLSPQQDLQQR